MQGSGKYDGKAVTHLDRREEADMRWLDRLLSPAPPAPIVEDE